jgi:hypothetical protein
MAVDGGSGTVRGDCWSACSSYLRQPSHPVTPQDDSVRELSGPYAEAGFGHALVSFADPYTVAAWTGRDADGVPDLVEQIRLVGHEVLPVLRP